MKRINILKIILINLLILCVLPLPSRCYTLLKLPIALGISILVEFHKSRNQNLLALIYFILFLLFQPFCAIKLDKLIWVYLDVGVLTFLQLSFLFKSEFIANRYFDYTVNLRNIKENFQEYIKPKLFTKMGKIIVVVVWVLVVSSGLLVGSLVYEAYKIQSNYDEEYEDYYNDRGHSGDY